MPLYFFPRDRRFWLYHCSTLAVGLIAILVQAYRLSLLGRLPLFETTLVVTWLLTFTLLVLSYRWLYKRLHWEAKSIGRVIAYAVAYSGLAAVLNVLVVVSIALRGFWVEFSARFPHFVGKGFDDLLIMVTIAEWTQCAVVILAWCISYIGVTTSARSRRAEVANLRLQNSLKDAQLASLSNQLNPHFLFNSLNNIRFMMHEDARHADAMITAFSEILRYSLESSRHEKVRLADELAIIRKYISIVQTQLEHRLHFQMHIAAGLDEALMPPMMLQLLVENAIKHGLDNLQQGGTLTLDGRSSSAGTLELLVTNDTPAASSQASQGMGIGMGIGLRNIEQRLALLYGASAVLDTEHLGQRFTARLTLPMETTA